MRMPERPKKDEVETSSESSLNKKGIFAVFCISVIVVFGVVLFFMIGNDEEPEKVVVPAVAQEKSSPVETPAPVKKEDKGEQKNYYGAGEYKIGVDIPAGEYLAIGTGYIELTSSSKGNSGSIIFNDNITDAQRYVEVRDGEYLKISRQLKLYQEKDAPKADTSEKVPAGQYKVGIDIPAGEYRVTCDDNGAYIEVSKTSRGDIVTNRLANSAGNIYITVSNGYYLKINRGEANLVSKGS